MVIKRELAERHGWALTNVFKASRSQRAGRTPARRAHRVSCGNGLLPAEARQALAAPLVAHASPPTEGARTIAQYSLEQGLTPRLMTLDELFAPSMMRHRALLRPSCPTQAGIQSVSTKTGFRLSHCSTGMTSGRQCANQNTVRRPAIGSGGGPSGGRSASRSAARAPGAACNQDAAARTPREAELAAHQRQESDPSAPPVSGAPLDHEFGEPRRAPADGPVARPDYARSFSTRRCGFRQRGELVEA